MTEGELTDEEELLRISATMAEIRKEILRRIDERYSQVAKVRDQRHALAEQIKDAKLKLEELRAMGRDMENRLSKAENRRGIRKITRRLGPSLCFWPER